jgi:hypothetical protein
LCLSFAEFVVLERPEKDVVLADSDELLGLDVVPLDADDLGKG